MGKLGDVSEVGLVDAFCGGFLAVEKICYYLVENHFLYRYFASHALASAFGRVEGERSN